MSKRTFPQVKSFGQSLSCMVQDVVSLCASQEPVIASHPSRSYSTDLYEDVELMEGGFVIHPVSKDCPFCQDASEGSHVKHPYSTDCPFCHNVKTADAVANAPSVRTERGMKYFRKG